MWVIKRNGTIERFTIGRVALAVFKAAQAQKPPFKSSVARDLGSKVSQIVAEQLAKAEQDKVNLEDIQDLVVANLKALGYEELAEDYENYRQFKMSERARLNEQKRIEKNFKLTGFKGNVLEFSRQEWANVLEKALLMGAGKEWTVAQWWNTVKDDIQHIETFDDFIKIHIKKILEKSQDKVHWLNSAKALLLERWYQRVIGVSPLLKSPEETTAALKLHYKTYWIQRKTQQKARWFPEIMLIEKWIDNIKVEEKDALFLTGLIELEKKFGHGVHALLPQELMLNTAIALYYSQGSVQDEGQHVSELAQRMIQGDVIPPLSLIKQAHLNEPCLVQETVVKMSDSLKSVFSNLTQAAVSVKSGSVISLDMTALRSEGSLVGTEGQMSGGLGPIIRLFGDACNVLKGHQGDVQKVRVSLNCWHKDLETFLAFTKVAPKELRASIILNDIFMKRVFEDGDWLLVSPSEADQLKNVRGDTLEKWFLEYESMAKNGLLEEVLCLPAREVFRWICDAVSGNKGPSIIFGDACIDMNKPEASTLLSARMSSVFESVEDQVQGVLELGWDAEKYKEKPAVLLKEWLKVHELMEKIPLNKQKIIAPVGQLGLKEWGQLLSYANVMWEKKEGVELPKESLWRDKNPWKKRLNWIESGRGGYIIKGEDQHDHHHYGRTKGPLNVMSLSSREEYLWLTGRSPMFVNHDQYRHQLFFEEIRVGFGGDGQYDSIKDQIRRAAQWQKWTDGGLGLDLRAKEWSESSIGEAIKQAWLNGLIGIRRFI